ncbi:5-dehydro-2-deoxygluconokinase [Actinomadura chokoriensis]|uniref:5-dehydro-2-deoxygluconokinase n=1 Tax=Actinomadura chokoriensis TaxID=454156 RepID=A0ABV4QPA0_9ACTN
MTRFDVITMGRVGVDLYPLQSGARLDEVETFARFLGGSATNVAVAAARLGRRAAVVTRTGADPFGRFVRRALADYGVDARFVADVPGLPTPVTFCELFPPDDFPLYFYRFPKAPDLEIRADELDVPAIEAAGLLWTTVTGLCAEPSRTATLAALGARRRAGLTVLDLDYRPMFWDSPAEAGRRTGEALEQATVAVGNLTECEVAVGESDPMRAARALLDRGVRLAVVKRGPDGVLAVDDRGHVVEAPPVPVEVVNGLGAGDAFGGALCHGLLAGWDLPRAIGFANRAGAVVASRLACSDAMPTLAEIESAVAP